MPGIDQVYGRPDIDVIVEAGASDISDSNSEPTTKKTCFEG